MSKLLKEYLPSSVIKWVHELGWDEDELEYQFTAGPSERDYEAEAASNERWMIFKPPIHYTVTAMRGEETYSQRFFVNVPSWQRTEKYMPKFPGKPTQANLAIDFDRRYMDIAYEVLDELNRYTGEAYAEPFHTDVDVSRVAVAIQRAVEHNQVNLLGKNY